MRTIHNRLDRLEARSPDLLASLTDVELRAIIAQLADPPVENEDVPHLIADCLGWDRPRTDAFITDLLVS